MTKGLDFDFLGLYQAILADCEVYLPNRHVQWERDLNRLVSLYKHRGPSIFTIDLPALGKSLDLSLANRSLNLEGLNHSGSRHPNSKIPRLFWGLWSLLFDDAGCLKDDVDPNVVLFLRTLLYAGKNFKSDCSPRYLYEAIGEFYAIESQMAPPSQIWDGDGSDLEPSGLGHLCDLSPWVLDPDVQPLLQGGDINDLLRTVQRTADMVSAQFGWFDPAETFFRHGPGAVSDLTGGSYKYDFPTWSDRLESVFPWSEYGTTGLGLGFGSDTTITPRADEGASALKAVPKSMKGPRLIAAEPTSHQWIQQGIAWWLSSNLERTLLRDSIDFRSQRKSRELALAGSLTGRYATIDLKSASDRISCHLVQRIFRRNLTLLRPMIVSRTRYMTNDEDKSRERLIKLRKFSTQGSALTFPIQSIIFATVAIGVGKFLNPTRDYKWLGRQVQVFGDDIIVPNHWEPSVRVTLELLGLRVNVTKTFSKGNFRESCGMDAWEGHDVTPPHILSGYRESDPGTLGSLIAVSNNFYLKGFWRAADWIVSSVPPAIRNKIAVVGPTSGVFGLVSRCGGHLASSLKKRWNGDLHREEVRLLCISAKSKTVKQNKASALLQYFTAAPDPYYMYESGVAVAGVPITRHTWVPTQELGLYQIP
ncbi:RNA-directed RNA polymerase [ssRNA phage Zoerhiza.2_27]|uniref:RNA-directed RNA polymerase n=2 Tax=Leviviricetes TaxID=2842243 RepID=A0A8S5KXK9_9VIRU|nr:RNA-directed RNA polymerase [ssRNA phage Zoerhiza.2_27]QDH90442.1 MAG: RNA-dependent RNA polymerase [Leviviridae sp.]DAD49968.1 TPA_asm: RNA-directed RNA polymerase [ssRNA phage Zoerhiza.2_27]